MKIPRWRPSCDVDTMDKMREPPIWQQGDTGVLVTAQGDTMRNGERDA